MDTQKISRLSRQSNRMYHLFIWVVALSWITPALATDIPTSERSRKAIAETSQVLAPILQRKDLHLGMPVFIRIFKQSHELEVWFKTEDEYKLFKTYDICNFSGSLGPKTKQGDFQSPEGFYFVTASNLNPWSQYHLSFNLGYPNAYDQAHGYTGSALMVHGRCVSIGCYAMTDEYMNEIYTIIHKALEHGQPFFRVHIFPFRMTEDALKKHRRNRWNRFWRNLKTGYDFFETYREPPNVTVANKRYQFSLDENSRHNSTPPKQ